MVPGNPILTNGNSDDLARLKNLQKKAQIPGVAIAGISNGQVVWFSVLGVVDSESKKPVSRDTIFWACSLSKPVFAYLVLKLIEDKILPQNFLNLPLHQFLKYDNRFSDSATKEDRETITAGMVLSHTTGLPNWTDQGTGIGPLKFEFSPGTQFGYSGEAFLYLQKVIEQYTHATLEELAEAKIFGPLGMEHSSFSADSKKFEKYDHAIGHDELGHPKTFPISLDNNNNAAASLYTTATDYVRFVAACLSDVRFSCLGDRTLAGALRNSSGSLTGDKKASGKKIDTQILSSLKWAFGFGLQTVQNKTSEETIAFHWGDGLGTKAFVAMNLSSKSAMVYFANSENGLSIAPEIFNEYNVGNLESSFKWLFTREGFEKWDSPYQRALVEEAKGDYDSAIALLKEALRSKPENKKIEYRIEWLESLKRSEIKSTELTEEKLEQFVGEYGPLIITVDKTQLQLHFHEGKKYSLLTVDGNTFLDTNDRVILRFMSDENNRKFLSCHFSHGGKITFPFNEKRSLTNTKELDDVENKFNTSTAMFREKLKLSPLISETVATASVRQEKKTKSTVPKEQGLQHSEKENEKKQSNDEQQPDGIKGNFSKQ